MKGCLVRRAEKIAAFLLAAALVGCAGAPADRPASAPPVADTPASDRSPAPEPAPVARATPDESAPEKEKIVIPAPEKLLGMKRSEIVRMMGQPDFRRHDDPALLMRYRDKVCILDLYLYPPVGKNGTAAPAVKHVEARRVRGDRMATRACIESVMKSRAAKAPG